MVGVASSAAPRVQVIARSAAVRLKLSRALEDAGVILAPPDRPASAAGVDVVVVSDIGPDALSALSPRVGVIVVGGDGREAAARLSGSDRAFGIVGDDADPAALKAAVQAVAAGFRVLPPALRPTRLAPDTTDPAEEDALLDEPLTPREYEVLELAAQGLSNHGIATRLGISDHTVKFHLASVYGKLGVRSRTAAVRRGLSRGLITI